MNINRVIKRLEDLTATVLDLFPTSATPEQAEYGRRLAQNLQDLAAASAAGGGSPFWQDICGEFRRLANDQDPMFFMRWDPIRATMVHGATARTFAAWWHLRRDREWGAVWGPALRHRQFGHPPPFLPMMSTNAMAIEHATHLQRFQAWAGRPFYHADGIMEFGGGFGSMCRMIHAVGYKGAYAIFDLPPVLLLQQYYLALHGVDTEPLVPARIRLCSNLERVEEMTVEHGVSRLSIISTWALSEMPMPLRQRIETFLEHPACHQVLLAYQSVFEGQDNRRYFADLRARLDDRFDWLHVPTEPANGDASPHASFYLFGKRRVP